MSWRDRLRKASLGGVSIQIDGAEGQFGRNTQVHEYAKRDKPYVEDLGRAARELQLDCIILSNAANGYNYMPGRDALIAEIEKAGPKKLVHPYYGDMTVSVVGKARVSESTREGGMARITITVIESGDLTFPTTNEDTPITVKRYAVVALGEVETVTAFKLVPDKTNATVGLIKSWTGTLTSLVSRFTLKTDAITDFMSAASALSGTASKLILTPQKLTTDMLELYSQLFNIVSAPKAALDIVRSLFGFGDSLDPLPPSPTNTRAAQQQNRDALVQLVEQGALLTAVQASAQIEYDSSDTALSVRNELLAQFDRVTELGDNDDVYDALIDARTAFAADIEQRAAQLDKLVTITLPVSIPALVLAYDLYGDATRADEIVTRNQASDPLFLPAGVELEVLANA